MDYGDYMCDVTTLYDKLTLQKLLNSVARGILQLDWMTPMDTLHEELDMDRSSDRRE